MVTTAPRGGKLEALAYHALVSDPGPLDPFEGLPFLGDLLRMIQGTGALNWDAARQVAVAVATEGKAEPNVDPNLRFRYQELARIAELHVQQVTGLDASSRPPEIVPVTPGVWAVKTLDAYRPLFERLATSLGQAPKTPPPTSSDDPMAFLGSLSAMLAPMMLGLGIGSMVGHLARHSFGSFDLPIPRPPAPERFVVADTIERFGTDWSLPADDLRLWVITQELATDAVLGVPHLRAELERLLREYVAGFRPDPDALQSRLESIDVEEGDPMGALQRAFGDPEVVLGAIRSPEQLALLPRLDALVAVVVGVVDHTVDRVAAATLGSADRIAEAVRRRRVEADRSDLFTERLLGVNITRQQVERGHAFVTGVVERAGDEGVAKLWRSARQLPTPAEVDAPGLWLARIDLPDEA